MVFVWPQTSFKAYGRANPSKKWVATSFHWAEAHQGFRSRSQGVATAVWVFVRLKENINKYWDSNAVYIHLLSAMVLFTTMMKLQIRIYPFESTMIFTHCYIWSKNCCNLLIVTVFFSAFPACCREKAKTLFSSSWITVRMSSYCLKAISEFLSSLIFWVKVLLTFWMLVINSSIVLSLDSYTDHGNTYSLFLE